MFQQIMAILLFAVQAVIGVLGGVQTPAAPMPTKDCYPIVHVGGVGCWGDDADINDVLHIWGMFAESLEEYLQAEGYEVYSASIGPISSNWDRACEIYASLTGTRVDYGEAHAKTHNHDRYGETYETPLVEDWGPERKVHLLSHSYGGATIRMLAHLCEEGSAEERAATPAAELSPLFKGEAKGQIASVTTLASPNNGSSALEEPNVDSGAGVLTSLYSAAALLSIVSPRFDEFWPFRFAQFDLTNEDFRRNPVGTLKRFYAFINNDDNAKNELTIDGALKVNESIDCQPDIYYFSYYGDKTVDDGSGNRIPVEDIWFLLRSSATALGTMRENFVTEGGYIIDETWLPNDGFVNVISAMFPFGDPFKLFDAEAIEAGIWQVMPVLNFDHADFSGGFTQLGGTDGIFQFYSDWAGMLETIR